MSALFTFKHVHSQIGPQNITVLHSAQIMVYIPTKFPFQYATSAL